MPAGLWSRRRRLIAHRAASLPRPESSLNVSASTSKSRSRKEPLAPTAAHDWVTADLEWSFFAATFPVGNSWYAVQSIKMLHMNTDTLRD